MPALISFIFLAALILTSCAKTDSNQAIIMNMNYHDARKFIIQNGWQPAQGLRPNEEIGLIAVQFRDMGYSEVDDCAGSGLAPCIFYFQNEAGEYLQIGTEGEDPRIIYAAIRNKID